MVEKFKKRQRLFLTVLIIICVGAILIGSIHYINKLKGNLTNNALQDVMNVTLQQKQAFDSFISTDRERLHSYAKYFSENPPDSAEEASHLLTMFEGSDAIYAMMCLDEGWAASSLYEESIQLDEETLEAYRDFPTSGVRNNYIGIFSGNEKFSYYETFTFKTGHRGMVQSSYDRGNILETFALSLYNGQGYGYILDGDGDILLRSVDRSGKQVYGNVFDALTDTHSSQQDISDLKAAMDARETGSTVFTGDNGQFVYTYTPVESVEDWYLLSIVPMDAITTETEAMLRDTQMTFGLFAIVLLFCAVFVQLMWRTHKDIEAKDREAAYQTRLFNIFTTYLSRNTDDMYIMLDQRTEEIEYVSSNLERVLGVTNEELVNYFKTSDMAADPEAAKAYYTELKAMTPGMITKPRNVERINPKTGEHRYFVESAYCVDVEGQAKRIGYISDRTKEHKAQSDLSDALQMARTANRAKSTFLSSISHDIRTPMNAIIGFLPLLKNEADNPEAVREYAQRIDAASQHLLGLINDVLDMNKIESGSTTLNISELSLAEVIDEINTIIRPQARAKNQTFDIFVSHINYEHLLGDKLRINQILINLLSNAVKYTHEGGTIEMRAEELSQVVSSYSHIRFTIKDNGMGMSEDYLKVIFDPFTREEKKSTYSIQGTGLGMAITKSLVDLMGGSIQVESAPGKGSTFTVELELRIQEREDDPKFWETSKVRKIIVTDDEEDVCLNIVKIMSKAGVVTEYATDGETALNMMRSAREAGQPYDLILLDWKMPGLNGLETARLIREKYSNKIPILLLTAYDWSDIEHEAREIGVNHFMPKPFFMSSFKDAIRRVIGTPQKAVDSLSDVLNGKHVLAVDDNKVNRLLLVKLLGTVGAICDTADNGQEAVDKFEASQPGEYDMILMDVQMPVMDGYAATRTIRSSSHPSAKTVPIIAMTANAFVEDVRDALESGMDAHIAKPLQVNTLKSTIQQVLDSRKQSQA